MLFQNLALQRPVIKAWSLARSETHARTSFLNCCIRARVSSMTDGLMFLKQARPSTPAVMPHLDMMDQQPPLSYLPWAQPISTLPAPSLQYPPPSTALPAPQFVPLPVSVPEPVPQEMEDTRKEMGTLTIEKLLLQDEGNAAYDLSNSLPVEGLWSHYFLKLEGCGVTSSFQRRSLFGDKRGKRDCTASSKTDFLVLSAIWKTSWYASVSIGRVGSMCRVNTHALLQFYVEISDWFHNLDHIGLPIECLFCWLLFLTLFNPSQVPARKVGYK